MSTKHVKILFALACCIGAIYANPVDTTDSESSVVEKIASWFERNEFAVELPFVGSTVNVNARSLEDDQLDVKVQLNNGVGEARKSKLKKIFAPILILVILKAITLIPLALGILGLKTWNAIQLSFVTFVTSIALAVYELCKKVAHDHVHPVVSHTAPWPPAARQFDADAQQMAYSAYAN